MSFFSSPPLLDLGNNNDNNDNDDYGDSSTSPPSPPSPSPPPPEPSEGKKGDPIIVTSPPSPNQNSSNSNSSSNSPSPTSTPTPSDGKSSPIIGLSPSTTPTLTPNSSSENKHSPSVSSASNGSIDNSDNNSRVFTGATVSVGLLLLMMLGICFLCCRRRRRRKPRYYYGDDGKNSHNGSGDYYNPAQNPSDWHPSGNDHIVRVQQSQGMDSGGWGPVTPQQHSSDMSSNFSQRGPSSALPLSSPRLSFGVNCVAFSYEDLVAATDGFALRNLIGQGGFGYVHKGVLLNGKEVAVKCLKAGSGQGDREFQAEIEIISRVHHRHLVTLLGYCISGGQRILVYEFVPNNTLEYHLHSRKSPTLNWSYRMRIALGSAKGLAYLHEDCHPRIIHRDIKSANVLLDYSYEAKVADFGLAKLTTDTNTHVSTRVMGTFGYLAPEYASSGKLTEKSDVFSFGVMLLEIVTGRRPVDLQNMADDSLVDWARPLLTRGLEDGNFEELVDPFLEGNYNNRELSRIAACISASIRHSGKKRPKMSQIVRALEGDVSLEDLNESNVGHGLLMGSLSGSSEYGSSAYHADMKKFRQIALASQELGSSESSSGEMPQGHGQVSNYS